jgi:predicted Zn finger-like uncharacterized protein
MRHTCEHCETAYEIPDDKVAGKFLKVRCKMCHGTMHVVGLRALDAQGEQGAVWWCAIAHEPRGPYREDEVMSLVSLGDVHARTRMWCAGMAGWERVCESETLAWVYNAVIDHAAHDPMVLGMPSSVFERAALLSDGHGYFPDPTLKSGIIVLDEETQRSLERLHASSKSKSKEKNMEILGHGTSFAAETRVTGTRAEVPSLAGPIAAAALGMAAAAGGLIWFIASQTM